MTVRYPPPLQPGDLVGVPAPSSGVRPHEQERFAFCLQDLRDRGFRVRVGAHVGEGDGVVSAPAADRAAEVMAMLLDPEVRAVVPPWGGELAIEVLPLLDLDALVAAATWFVGYSDTTTLLLPYTLLTGTATLHAPGLMETPYAAPAPLLHWLDVATAVTGSVLRQAASAQFQGAWPDLREAPHGRAWALSEPTSWRRLGTDAPFAASGRLLGGCLETVVHLTGSRYGDVPRFVREHAPEGLVVHLEVAESSALDACRMLHGLRLAGWFDAATCVLLGRTSAPASGGFTQDDAVRSALGSLPVPVLLDVDLGHVPPQLSLVDGALATVTWEPGGGTVVQELV
ncbi:MAG: Peptidase LD-carboxypeptidase [Frankiales bacterium]|nr:Peptidase LD-carboxypeptidase [Frankiales bacterium]